jgi:hypothetical protein
MPFCLLNKNSSLFLLSNGPEYECKQFFWNVGNYLPIYPASYPIKTCNFVNTAVRTSNVTVNQFVCTINKTVSVYIKSRVYKETFKLRYHVKVQSIAGSGLPADKDSRLPKGLPAEDSRLPKGLPADKDSRLPKGLPADKDSRLSNNSAFVTWAGVGMLFY